MTESVAQPWYTYPWLWFVIAVPMSAVVAGFITLGIAIEHGPKTTSPEARSALQSVIVDSQRASHEK